MLKVILFVQFYRLTQLIISTLLKGIIRKECLSFTNHGHDKTPPTVFNPLSLWLTLPRDMGGQPHIMASQHCQSHSCVPVVCTGFAQGLRKVCRVGKLLKPVAALVTVLTGAMLKQISSAL